MIAVSTVLPKRVSDRPPIVLVHGAANSTGVWVFWQRALAARGWASHAIDLRGHGRSEQIDLSGTRMGDYADDVRSLVVQLLRPPVLMGWSMGGLVSMMVASAGDAAACVGLDPSPPAQRVDTSISLRTGEFGPEEYGIRGDDPNAQATMPDLDREERAIALGSCGRESRLARDERKAGVVVESLRCPTLIVTGSDWVEESRDGWRAWPGAEHHRLEGISHWGLVLNRRVLPTLVPRVHGWLASTRLAI